MFIQIRAHVPLSVHFVWTNHAHMTRVTYNPVIVPCTHSKPTALFTIFLLFFFNFVFSCVECDAGLVSCSISFFIYFSSDGVWSTPTADDVRVWVTSFVNLGRAQCALLEHNTTGYTRCTSHRLPPVITSSRLSISIELVINSERFKIFCCWDQIGIRRREKCFRRHKSLKY